MGFLSSTVDFIIILFSAVMIPAAPLIDAQSCLPAWLYHTSLIDLKNFYVDRFGDYLMKENPQFFVGLIWFEIFFLWPLLIANVYAILSRRSWASTTSLMIGVSLATSMAPVLAELIGSGRAPDKLLQIYFPFLGFAILAILRGLFSGGPRQKVIKAAASIGPSARKKRA